MNSYIPQDHLCELVYNWKFWQLPVYNGLESDPEEEPNVTSKTFYPKVRLLRSMAGESLRMVATALERYLRAAS